jgi:hypothetical protein
MVRFGADNRGAELLSSDKFREFKGCLGAIDGTMIEMRVPHNCAARYRCVKLNKTAMNVMVACDFTMCITSCQLGAEGTAYDSYVLQLRRNGLSIPDGILRLINA